MTQIKNTLSFFFIFLFSISFANELHLSKIEDFIEKNKATKAYQYYQDALTTDATLEASSEGMFIKARVYDALFREGKTIDNLQLEKEALVSYLEVSEKGTSDYATKSDIHLSKFEHHIQDKARAYTKSGTPFKSLELATVLATVHEISSNYLFLAKVEDYNSLFELAHKHYLKAINLDSKQEEKIFVRVLVLMNEFGDAAKDKLVLINKGLEVYPINKELLIEKMYCFQKIGESNEEKLEDLYLAIANADSENQYVLYALGKLYYHQSLRVDSGNVKWTQAKAYLELASKSQYINSDQRAEVIRYLEKIQSKL